MIGKVGGDAFGRDVLQNFRRLRIDTTSVSIDNSVSTGIAHIVVNKNGGNSIIIIGGANDKLRHVKQ